MNNEQADSVIIIPAFNEEASLPHVIHELLHLPIIDRVIDIIVINNGSTDQTKEVAIAHGVMVVDEPTKGYGRACLTGIAKALELEPQYLLFIDGDFSDDPNDLTRLLKELDHGCDFVLGSRMLGKAQKGSLLPQAKLGNKLATFLMSHLFGGFRFSDLGPLRGIRSDSYQLLNMCDQNFGWTIEMQIKAIQNKLTIKEISVGYKKRIGISKISGTVLGTIKAGYKIIWTIFYYFFVSKFSRSKVV